MKPIRNLDSYCLPVVYKRQPNPETQEGITPEFRAPPFYVFVFV